MKTILALSTNLVLVALYNSGQATQIELVRKSRSSYVIVHALDAPTTVRKAAHELHQYIEKTTKAKVPIVAGAAPKDGPFISLGNTHEGRAAGVIVDEIPIEGFRILGLGSNLYIAGLDTVDNGTTPGGGTSTGTLNGVYTFIEDYLDVRWLLPGPMGEDVVFRANVTIPPVDRTEAPFFWNRRVPGMQNDQPAVKEWSSRQKLGYSMKLEHAHNWKQVVPETLHTEHPDWFPEVHGQRPPVTGERYKLETTNTDLIQYYAQAAIEAFRKNPKLQVFSLSPTDSGGWSTSSESKALYDSDPHGKLSVTPLILKFYNDVAKIVAKEFPERKLAGYVYASYLYPPSAGVPPLETNLFLVVAPSISYGYQLYREGVKEEWDGILTAWTTATPNVAYYDLFNWLRGSTGAITPPAPEILNFAFPRLRKYGIKGVYIYGTSEWSQAAVNNYVLSKMAWNPSLDANAVCNEFYQRAYGQAAGESIRKIYLLVDKAVKDFYNDDLTANYTATPRFHSDVLATHYPTIEAYYLEAQQAALSASTAQRERLAFFGENIAIMQWKLRAAGFLPESKSSPLYRNESEIETMMGNLHVGFGIELAPGMKPAEKSFPPVSVTWTPPISSLRAKQPLGLRGQTRFLVFPNADQEISVKATKIGKPGTLIRCDAYSAAGTREAGGMLRLGIPIQFLGSKGQIYYVEVNGGDSPYEVDIQGAAHALATNIDPRGVHISGKAATLYFHVPSDVPQFTISTSSSPPGETSLSKLYAPSGKLVETFDTQVAPTARSTITRTQAGNEWSGFWCLLVEKAPKGGLDDVYVSIDDALPQWLIVDPDKPLEILPLRSFK